VTPSLGKIESFWVRSAREFRQLESAWAQLLARIPDHSPFSTFDWYCSWIDAYAIDMEICTLAAASNAQIVGIAPLCVRPGGLVTFLAYPQNDYASLLVDPSVPGVLEALLAGILSIPVVYKRIVLDQIPEGSLQYDALAALLRRAGKPFRVELADACPAMSLSDVPAARALYYKRNINTYVNWYKKHTAFAYNVYTNTQIALQRLNDLFDQHINRWRGTSTPSDFSQEALRSFYRSFVSRMHPKGWIHFSSLTLDDTFLAFFLSFEYGRRLYLYKTSFNTAYTKRSPGQTLLRYLFDDAVSRQLTELDFCRGDEGYKGRFANVLRHNRRIIIYKRPMAKALASIFYSVRHSPAIDLLYRNRRVQALKQKARRSYRDITAHRQGAAHRHRG
jgi:CelD/BcsL family acetyltransferase involved in cellulose biosynthesis